MNYFATFIEDINAKDFPSPASNMKNPLKQWYDILSKDASTEIQFNEFFTAANTYCKKKKLIFLAVLDEENAVDDQSWGKFPFDYYTKIPVPYLFTCASSNNNTTRPKKQGWTAYSIKVNNFLYTGNNFKVKYVIILL